MATMMAGMVAIWQLVSAEMAGMVVGIIDWMVR